MINNYLVQQIKGNFLYKPTLEQEKAVKSLADFLFSRPTGFGFSFKRVCRNRKDVSHRGIGQDFGSVATEVCFAGSHR